MSSSSTSAARGGRSRGSPPSGRRGRVGAARASADGDVGGSAALVSLRGDDLVVEGTHLEASGLPGVEVVGGGDGSAGAVGLPDGPELSKGGGSLDGGLVHALVEIDFVGSSVAGDCSLVGAARGRVIAAEALDDVVLDEGVGSPAVDGEVPVTRRIEGTAVVDCPKTRDLRCHGSRSWQWSLSLLGRSGVPALASDEVADVGPRHAVFACGAVVVSHRPSTISPEGVEEAVVGSRAGWRRASREVTGEGSDAGDCCRGEEEGAEGDHVV